MNTKSRRGGISSWLVEPYRQVKIGLIFLFLNLIFSILILGVFGYYTFDIYSTMSAVFKLTPTEGQQILAKFQTPVIMGTLLMVVFVFATLIISVRYTHQIYGPLVSIQRFLDDILKGKSPKKLALRSSDQLQELAEQLNGVAATLDGSESTGPIIAINRFVDDLTAGKTPEKIQLRENDPLHTLAEKLNKLTDK